MNEITYCDDCGDPVREADFMVFAEVPYDVASANKGESAVVCLTCHAAHGDKPSRCWICGEQEWHTMHTDLADHPYQGAPS